MLSIHATLLFLCAECRLYRSRKTMLPHMVTHVNHLKLGMNIPEESQNTPEIAKQDPSKIIPIVRIQRHRSVKPKLFKPAALVETTSSLTSPHSNVILNPPTSESLQSVPFDPLLLQNVELINQNNSKTNMCDIDANNTVTREHRTDTDSINDELSKVETNNSNQDNEFSDHSDTENEFGQLPESVFDAIEDSQDDHSANDSPETEITNPGNKNANSTLPRPCPVCQKLCTSLSGWYYHLKRAHGNNKSLACNNCNKLFNTKSELATHARTHTKEKPFACRKCEAAFSSRAGRYIHEQTHGTKRPNVCDRCPRAFRWKAQLSRHLARHDANRNHVCSQCGRAFSVAFDLLRHVRAHNPGCYKCDICNATYKQKRYLKVHMENIHLRMVTATPDKQTS